MTRERIGAAEVESHLPLTAATFEILLSLVGEERHGYAIMKAVADRTSGSVKLGPGTLYAALKRLLEAELIDEGDERADPESGDERRRYYRITRAGLAVLGAETRRMESMVRAARRKKLIGLEPA